MEYKVELPSSNFPKCRHTEMSDEQKLSQLAYEAELEFSHGDWGYRGE